MKELKNCDRVCVTGGYTDLWILAVLELQWRGWVGGGFDVNIVKDALLTTRLFSSCLWYVKDTLEATQSLSEESLFFKKAAYTYRYTF